MVIGDDAQDRVCMHDNNTCVLNFRFLGVTNSQNISAIDGIIGLAPDDPSNGPSFVAQLKTDGYIDKKMFGIGLKTSSSNANITFGSVDSSYSNIIWYNQKYNSNWTVELWSVTIGTTTLHATTESTKIA
jgi:hypothetical protein